VSLAGCERLAMGPAGATSQISLVMRGCRRRFCWSGWGDDVGDRVGAGQTGLRRGRARPTPPLRGRADVVVSQGRGQVLVDACCL